MLSMVEATPDSDGSISCHVKSFFYPLNSRLSHTECNNRAIYGYLCLDHAKKYDHVQVKESLLEGAGLGLFATQESPPICPYLSLCRSCDQSRRIRSRSFYVWIGT